MRPLPLGSVPVNVIDPELNFLTLLDSIASKSCLFKGIEGSRSGKGRGEPESLIHDLGQEIKLVAGFTIDDLTQDIKM